jgi:hypothetical protein
VAASKSTSVRLAPTRFAIYRFVPRISAPSRLRSPNRSRSSIDQLQPLRSAPGVKAQPLRPALQPVRSTREASTRHRAALTLSPLLSTTLHSVRATRLAR